MLRGAAGNGEFFFGNFLGILIILWEFRGVLGLVGYIAIWPRFSRDARGQELGVSQDLRDPAETLREVAPRSGAQINR